MIHAITLMRDQPPMACSEAHSAGTARAATVASPSPDPSLGPGGFEPVANAFGHQRLFELGDRPRMRIWKDICPIAVGGVGENTYAQPTAVRASAWPWACRSRLETRANVSETRVGGT